MEKKYAFEKIQKIVFRPLSVKPANRNSPNINYNEQTIRMAIVLNFLK